MFYHRKWALLLRSIAMPSRARGRRAGDVLGAVAAADFVEHGVGLPKLVFGAPVRVLGVVADVRLRAAVPPDLPVKAWEAVGLAPQSHVVRRLAEIRH